jgi:hypothetical protein
MGTEIMNNAALSRAFVALFGLVTIVHPGHAQTGESAETLLDLARRVAPNPIRKGANRELVPDSYENMLARTDIVVIGSAKRLRTYLSENQRELYTDYEISPVRILFQAFSPSSARPGVIEPIVLTVWGGHTTIEGVEVVIEDADAPVLEGQSSLLLHLSRESNGKYKLANDVTGASSVVNGRVGLLGKPGAYDDAFRSLQGQQLVAVEDLIAKLRSAAGR